MLQRASLFLLLLCGLAVPALPGQRLKVFVFAGQSNMVGADTDPERIDDYPPYVGAARARKDVRYAWSVGRSTSSGWSDLAPVDGDFGPELTFARRVSAALDDPIAIIKCAVGGTTIAKDWNPDSPEDGQQLFLRAVELVRESLAALDQKRIDYDLEAVFWHQGENDMLNRDLNPAYESGLTRFIERMREELGAPELRWFVGEVSDKGIWGMDHRRQMRELHAQQRRVVDADPLVYWVPTSHLAFEVMGSGQPHYHFGTQGQLQHGEAYAQAYLRVIGLSETDDEPSYRDGPPMRSGKTVRVFLLCGQRNMEGEDAFVAELRGRDARFAKPLEDVPMRVVLGGGAFESAEWMPLGATGHLGNFGPELSFGRTLERRVEDPVAILKFTDSSAQITDWCKSSDDANRPRYDALLEFVTGALADLEARGAKPVLEAVVWHHGENETYYGPFRARYAELLGALIDSLRRDLTLPTLEWIVGEQSEQGPWGAERIEEMNAALRALAAADPHVRTVPTSDLPHARLHFGTEGTLRLGERLAETWLALREE